MEKKKEDEDQDQQEDEQQRNQRPKRAIKLAPIVVDNAEFAKLGLGSKKDPKQGESSKASVDDTSKKKSVGRPKKDTSKDTAQDKKIKEQVEGEVEAEVEGEPKVQEEVA